MPPRLSKRQLREQEELHALQEVAHDAAEDQSESNSPVASSQVPVGGFAALMTTQEEDEESEGEETHTRSPKSKKARELYKKKKKKTAATTPAASFPAPEVHSPAPDSAPSTPAGPSKKERKALKKQKAKEKQKDEMDDVDKALAELSLKYPDLKQQLASTSAPTSSPATVRSLAGLLAVSLAHLDSEAELRKFFGSKSAAQRSNLTRPKGTWWPAQLREGLSVRPLTQEDVDESLRRHLRQPLHGEKVWTVEYSKKYRAVTFDFMRTVLSGDPEGFYQLLRVLPYHADTLLQLSEVYHHREEHSTAADYVDRSLFTYERAFVGAFNFTSGANRLDFDYVENRPFFLALHRQVTDLQRRGCVRTAFEFARLLSHGALLHIDYLAIKAGMSQWLVDLWDLFEPEIERGVKDAKSPYVQRILPNILPGVAYSRALALFIREEESGDKTHERSTGALEYAVRTFPSVAPLLADKADISLSGEIRGHAAFRIQTDRSWLLSDSHSILHLLSHLYAARSSSLWKPAARASWFIKAVSSVLPSLPNSSPASPKFFSVRFDSPSLAYSIYRHVLVNESSCRNLLPFLPSTVREARHLACDPLPPPTRANEYDAEFFRGIEDVLAARPRSRRQEARLLERLVPDAAFRGQLFAQWAGQMPEDLEDLFLALGAIEQQEHMQGDGRMPGGMPGGEMMVDFVDPEDVEEHELHPAVAQAQAARPPDREDEDEEDEEEEEDEVEDVVPLPMRVLRNVFGRFWGGGGNTANEDSSNEEDAQLRDNEGVD
ncbi:transcriptional repressor TCF25-domain-containing protein [Fomes fomentarius]|nr:transcriptional repressor TCF25-domain-containing protein [Fomes fomentarius]